LRPWTTIHDHAQPDLRAYLLALLNLRLGDFRSAAEQLSQLEARTAADTAASLARAFTGSLRAQMLRLEGRPGDALTVLEATAPEAPFEYAMASPFWSQALERYLRAELLAELGRYSEALAMLRTFSENSPFDAIYRAPAALKAAEIAERRGEPATAILHYRRFIDLWQDSDPELRPLVVEAQRRIERLQHGTGAAR
jgi:tetratricopeptide (TPR) repeat protein